MHEMFTHSITPGFFEPTDLTSSGAWAAQWIGFTRVSMTDEWLYPALGEVRRLAALEPNWDGYGSPAVQGTAVEAAVSLLGRFASEVHGLPVPAVAPVTGGGLHLEFGSGGRELEIEVLSDSSIEVLLTGGEDEAEWQGRADRLNVPALAAWLLEAVE